MGLQFCHQMVLTKIRSVFDNLCSIYLSDILYCQEILKWNLSFLTRKWCSATNLSLWSVDISSTWSPQCSGGSTQRRVQGFRLKIIYWYFCKNWYRYFDRDNNEQEDVQKRRCVYCIWHSAKTSLISLIWNFARIAHCKWLNVCSPTVPSWSVNDVLRSWTTLLLPVAFSLSTTSPLQLSWPSPSAPRPCTPPSRCFPECREPISLQHFRFSSGSVEWVNMP